jgi:hypothetical protein
MKIDAINVNMQVKHPQYGVGTVKSITEHTVDVVFENTGRRTLEPDSSGLEPAEATASISGLQKPLDTFIRTIVEEVITRVGYEKPDTIVDQLGARWHRGRVVLHPADPTLQTKEIPAEVFFHKVVGLRNQLRVLEQKINAHTVLTDGEKVEMQQYISRCYGSLTTFNLLFKNKEDQFNSKGGASAD